MGAWRFHSWEDDFPPCWCSCIKPFHCGPLPTELKTINKCHRRSIPRDGEKVVGDWSWTNGLKTILDRLATSGASYHRIGIFFWEDISVAVRGDFNLFMQTGYCDGWSRSFVPAAIIPIPWNVSLPSRVHMLWSTLSATHCMKDPLRVVSTAFSSLLMMECLNRFTSAGLMANPSLNSSFVNHFHPNKWSASTPSPKSNGGIYDFGLSAFVIACPMEDCFSSSDIKTFMKRRRSGTRSLDGTGCPYLTDTLQYWIFEPLFQRWLALQLF